MKKTTWFLVILLFLAGLASFLFLRQSHDSTRVKLYYFKGLTIHAVERGIQGEKTPLKTLALLLQGPSSQEKQEGILSLIPKGGEILGISEVDGGIVAADLDEAFAQIHGGAYHEKAALAQLVYTLTEFPGIDQVQILIAGEKRDTLSGEGFLIDQPFSRDDFSQLQAK